MTVQPVPPGSTCKCIDAPTCGHDTLPEQRLAAAIFGERADPDRPCYHLRFNASVEVGRIGEGDDEESPDRMPRHFVAEIRVECAACGEAFKFDGVPAGMSFAAPATSVDGRELRAPIRPVTSPAGFPRRGDVTGFSVNVLRSDD